MYGTWGAIRIGFWRHCFQITRHDSLMKVTEALVPNRIRLKNFLGPAISKNLWIPLGNENFEIDPAKHKVRAKKRGGGEISNEKFFENDETAFDSFRTFVVVSQALKHVGGRIVAFWQLRINLRWLLCT